METENNMDRQADFPYGKIHPLTQPPQSILRSDLISDVIAALGCSDLVLIEGPSGSGKSTLLTQLSDALKSGGEQTKVVQSGPF